MTDDEARIPDRTVGRGCARRRPGRRVGGSRQRHRDVRRPPTQRRRAGIDAYRATWPPFFDWQRRGAFFEIVELDVTAGNDVAFAHALLRCGTPMELEKDPDNRLRLSIGLGKERGRWTVTHEHHSFPLP